MAQLHPPQRSFVLTLLQYCVVGFSALLFTGCGNGQPATYQVTGQLKFADGSVPKFGTIELYNAEHKLNARGKVEKDGTFTLTTFEEGDGAVAGQHQFTIIQLAGDPLLAKTEMVIAHDHGSLVHRKYFDYRTSGITINVAKKPNNIELVLDKSPNQSDEND